MQTEYVKNVEKANEIANKSKDTMLEALEGEEGIDYEYLKPGEKDPSLPNENSLKK